MRIIASLKRQLAYSAWANRQTLQSLLSAKAIPSRATEVMAHLISAEWLWLRRMGYPSPELSVWPTLSLKEAEQQLKTLDTTWRVLLSDLSENALERQVDYTNSQGQRWTNTVADILTHVLHHSSYHRGQIASFLGRAGETPAYTDYIECVRRGHVDDK